jgi:soluble calcium-activated nucleotidase 1
MMPGTLQFDPSANKYSVQFGDMRTLISGHNEAGRGMELSELTLYNNRLLAFDDRTGSVFEILSKNAEESFVVPRFVITEGEGDTDKGMKWEWATVKGDELVIGSMGKEYTRPDGSIKNTNNLWIATINSKGDVTRKDWIREYNFVRHLLGADAPGYVIHEAVLWSENLKKWIFIPRRVSADKYDDVLDEKKGTNKIVIVDERFTKGEVIDIKMDVDPLHGFSTASFVPNSNERHVVAVRSVEEDCVGGDESLCKQRSYMIVFDVLTGEVLMDEVKFESDVKFEGIEFTDVTLSPYSA